MKKYLFLSAAIFAASPAFGQPDLTPPVINYGGGGGSGGGGGGTPGGAANTVQYNNGGAFGGVGPGTTTTVLHGNAAGAPSYGAVVLTTDVSGILPSANGGAGSVSGIMQANGSGLTAAATLGNGLSYTSPKLSLTNTLNAQTGTSYAVASTDAGAIITASNASSQAYTIVQANTAGFTSGFGTSIANINTGAVTLTAATSTFANGLSTLLISKGQVADIGSDGTNYPITALSLPIMAQDTLLGNPNAANYPTAMTLPACASDGAHALTYASHALACTAVTGTAASMTVGTTTVLSGTTTKVLFDNAGVLGEYTISGSGNVAMTTSPAFTTPSLGAATATGLDMSGTAGSVLNMGASGVFKSGGTTMISYSGGNILVAAATLWGASGGAINATTPSGTSASLVPNWSNNSGIGASSSGVIDLIASSTDVARVSTTGVSLIVAGSDATHTDATVCRDTTSGLLYAGSGTLGICLGTSTARAKENVRDVSDEDELMKLRPVVFNYRKGWGYTDKQYYGFLAEDVRKVLPRLVGKDASGRPLNADYVGMIPLMVKKMQEQDQAIAALKAEKTCNRSVFIRLFDTSTCL